MFREERIERDGSGVERKGCAEPLSMDLHIKEGHVREIVEGTKLRHSSSWRDRTFTPNRQDDFGVFCAWSVEAPLGIETAALVC